MRAWLRLVAAIGLSLISGMILGTSSLGDERAAEPDVRGSLAELEREYDRQVSVLERKRFDDLNKLAGLAGGAEVDEVHRALFHTAVVHEWFHEAGQAANRYLAGKAGAVDVRALAALVAAMDGVEQGQVDRVLETLKAWLRARQPGDTADVLGASELLVRRLIHAAHYDAARKICELLGDQGGDEIASHFKARLRSLHLVGKPAPGFEAKDIDGQPFHLIDQRGKVVLMVFWATWCPPSLRSMARFNAIEAKLASRGLVVVGVNVDAHHREASSAAGVLSGVRHALVESGVGWPNILDQEGAGNIAKRFGVETVPATVLVGRDGKVIGAELDEARIEETLTRALAATKAQ